MRGEIKVKGVVLRKKRLKEKDLQVILFTEEQGKILAFAKGVQKITSRRLSHLDTGNLIKARVIQKGDFYYLSETSLISGFSSIKENLRKISDFFFVLKIIEKLSPERQKDKLLFQLLLKTIKEINEGLFNREMFIENLAKLSGMDKQEILEIV